MAIYFIFLSVVLILPCQRGCLFEYDAKSKRKWNIITNSQVYLWVILLFMILIGGLRSYTVGIDLRNHYLLNFQKYAAQPWDAITNYGIECGLFVLSKIISTVSVGGQMYIFVTSLIPFSLVIRFFYKYSEDFKFSIIIFVTYCMMYQFMNQIAQCIAVSIIILGYDFLKEGKTFKYLICVALASTFHTTALFCVVFLLIKHIKVTRKTMIWFSFFAVIFSVAYGYFFKIGAAILPQYEWYTMSMRHGVGDRGLGVIIRIFMLGAVVIWSVYLAKFKKRMNEFENIDFKIFMAYTAFVFQLITTQMIVMSRMSLYALPFVCLLVPLCVENIGSYRKTIKNSLYVGLIMYFTYITVRWGMISYGVVPYTFFWNNGGV